MKWLEPAYGLSFLKISLFLQEAADQAVAPVADQVAVPAVVPALAPVVVTVIMDLTEREAQEEMQNNRINININTSSSRKPRNRININTSGSRKPRNRININTNISIGRNPGHRISPISLPHSQTMPEEWSNSLPIIGSPK